MHATLITGHHQTTVVEVPEPAAKPGFTTVDVGLCGICGSDVSAWKSGSPYPPFLCGHEWFGTVLERGAAANGEDHDHLQAGRRVVMATPPTCGVCPSCRAGNWNRCQAFFGLFVGAPHGGYAPRIAVPSNALVPVPDALTDVEAAQVEPATVALHAVRRRGPKLGDVVLVLGAGPIGLGTLQHARLAGARRVIVAEPSPERRALALELGADVVSPPGAELEAAVNEATNGLGADLCYDCAGSPSSVNDAIGRTRPGGAVMMVGVSSAGVQIDSGIFLSKELVLDSSLAHHHHEFAITMQLVADGRLQLAPMHARTIGLDGLDAAFGALAGGAHDAKILVDPHA